MPENFLHIGFDTLVPCSENTPRKESLIALEHVPILTTIGPVQTHRFQGAHSGPFSLHFRSHSLFLHEHYPPPSPPPGSPKSLSAPCHTQPHRHREYPPLQRCWSSENHSHVQLQCTFLYFTPSDGSATCVFRGIHVMATTVRRGDSSCDFSHHPRL